MAMQSFPFTSEVTFDPNGYPQFDRAVDSQILRNVFRNYWTNGVFGFHDSSSFVVLAPSDGSMAVRVQPGACVIEGATAFNKETETLILKKGSELPRIDTIALRLNDNKDYRDIRLIVIEGIPSAKPLAPSLVRTDSIYDLGLANIQVDANISTFDASKITDTRLNKERCGYVTGIPEVDTTALFNQIQQAIKNFNSEQAAAFSTWFESIKEKLNGNVAATLIAEIEELKKNKIDESRLLPVGGSDGSKLTRTANGYSWVLPKTKVVTLVSSLWQADNTYTINDEDIKGNPHKTYLCTVTSSSADSSFKEYIEALKSASIQVLKQSSGTLKLYASGNRPTKDLRIQLIIE